MITQSQGVIGVFCPCCLWRKSRGAGGSDCSRCSAGWAGTSLPCCLELGMTLQLTGVMLVPLAHLPLQLWVVFDSQLCPCSVFLYDHSVIHLVLKTLCDTSLSVASCSNKLLFNIPDHLWGFGWSTICLKIGISSTFVCCTIACTPLQWDLPKTVSFYKSC